MTTISRVIANVSTDDLVTHSSYSLTIKLILDSATRELDKFKRRGGWNVIVGLDFVTVYDCTHGIEIEVDSDSRVIVFYS